MSEEIVDAEIVEENEVQDTRPLQVAVIGGDDNVLAQTTYRAFLVPKGAEPKIYSVDQLDECVETSPDIAFWCEPLTVKKNDTMDDTEFVASVGKLIMQGGAGVCIRTPINIEVHDRMMMTLSPDVVNNKVVYMPDPSESAPTSPSTTGFHLMGGSEKALQAHSRVLRNASWFGAGTVLSGTMAEVIFANLAISGYRLVRQKYFDEVNEAILDLKGANPMIVSRLFGRVIDEAVTPSYVNGNDVYDARIFAGSTDKLSLLESCLEN